MGGRFRRKTWFGDASRHGNATEGYGGDYRARGYTAEKNVPPYRLVADGDTLHVTYEEAADPDPAYITSEYNPSPACLEAADVQNMH